MNDIFSDLSHFQIPSRTYSELHQELFALSYGEKQGLLSAPVALFGLHFTGEISDVTQSTYGSKVFTVDDPDFSKLSHYNKPQLWRDPQYFALLEYFFGSTSAYWVRELLENVDQYLLGDSYHNKHATWIAPEFTFLKQCNVLSGLIEGVSLYNSSKGEYVAVDLCIEMQIQYAMHLSFSVYQPYLWAVFIDSKTTESQRVVDQILDGTSTYGRLTPSFLLMLMSCKQTRYWDRVALVLLNAAREEGLRQDIVSQLSHIHIANLEFFLKFILTHKLTRFESVNSFINQLIVSEVTSDKASDANKRCEMMLYSIAHYHTMENLNFEQYSPLEFYCLLECCLWIHRELAFSFVQQIYNKVSRVFQQVILEFINKFDQYEVETIAFDRVLQTNDLDFNAVIAGRLHQFYYYSRVSRFFFELENYQQTYQRFHKLYGELKGKKVIVKSVVDSSRFMDFVLDEDRLAGILLCLTLADSDKVQFFITHRSSFSSSFKEQVLNTLLYDDIRYGLQGYGQEFTGEVVASSVEQNQLAFAYLKERKEVLVLGCMRFLAVATLSNQEIEQIIAYFDSKFKKVHQHFIGWLVQRKDHVVGDLLERLLLDGTQNQRLVALEGLLVLAQRDESYPKLGVWLSRLEERQINYTAQEKEYLILLEDYVRQMLQGKDNEDDLYDPGLVTPVQLPVKMHDSFFSMRIQHNSGLSKPLSLLIKDLDALKQLLDQYAEYEYTIFDSSIEQKALIGTHFTKMHPYVEEYWTQEQHFEDYPLYEIWQQWFTQSGLDAVDLFLLCNVTVKANLPDELAVLAVYQGPCFYTELWDRYEDTWYAMREVFTCLSYKYAFVDRTEYCLEALKTLYTSVPIDVLAIEFEVSMYDEVYISTWVDYVDVFEYGGFVELENLQENQYLDYFKLLRWRELHCNKVDVSAYQLPFELMAYAYENDNVTKDEFIGFLIQLTSRKVYFGSYIKPFTKKFITAKVSQVFQEFVRYFLSKVIERDNPSSTVFDIVFDLERIEGACYFFGLLEKVKTTGMTKEDLYYYPGIEISLDELSQVYSSLIKKTTPLSSDSQLEFNQFADALVFNPQQWLEVAIAAPQWVSYICAYLQWEGLESAIWWLYAHLVENQSENQKDLLTHKVQRYTATEVEDFEKGVVDVVWFYKCYNSLGQQRWEMVYHATKYMNVEGHTRVKLYGDILLGRVSIEDLKAKILTKRDRNYVRACGLFPLSKTDKEQDLMHRYELLELFKKGSKKFGTMRQQNDLQIYNVAMQNLAKVAGFNDSNRFEWSMECLQLKSILKTYEHLNVEQYSFSLRVEQKGKVVLSINNQLGKTLKAVPAKLKKNEDVMELLARQKALQQQYIRSSEKLEQAMLRRDTFSVEEIVHLLEHPIIRHHLSALVFECKGIFGFFKNGVFTDLKAKPIVTDLTDQCSIAHCYDLYKSQHWILLQSYLFDHVIEQPFKQVFRELYLFNEAEQTNQRYSNRYMGYQVKQGQTLGLLKARNWHYTYYSDYSKLYFDQDLRVVLYLDYSSGVDGDYIEIAHVGFYRVSTQEALTLQQVDPIVFSEVMRDLDLVVSVAHVSGFNPQTSLATIQSRLAIVRETARLLKLDNITYKERHVIIAGTRATYSVHLGSGVIHVIPGKHVYIAPALTQDRGKLFLPFVDQEPKTTEIVSKVLILCRDKMIKDTSILSQIEGV